MSVDSKLFVTCGKEHMYGVRGYDEIMQVEAKVVAPFGDVYYNFNDCDDKGFVKLYNKGELTCIQTI